MSRNKGSLNDAERLFQNRLSRRDPSLSALSKNELEKVYDGESVPLEDVSKWRCKAEESINNMKSK